MRDRVKEPRPGDVWVMGGCLEITGVPYDAETLASDGMVPACVLPLEIAMKLQEMVAGMVVSAEIDGVTKRGRELRRILAALETATGEKMEAQI